MLDATIRPYLARIEALEIENERLRQRNHDLACLSAALKPKETTGGAPPPALLVRAFAVCVSEAQLLHFLLRGQVLSRDHILALMYPPGRKAVPKAKIIDIYVCRLRKALAPHGITIDTHWGTGWSMTRDGKARVKAMVAERAT